MEVDCYKAAKKYYDDKDYTEAYNILLKLAYSGNANAQFIVGYMIENGEGVKVDKDKAYLWYKKAADRDHEQALYMLAVYNFEHLDKIDIGKDYLEKSVALGCPEAIHFLATCLDFGEYGYEVDHKRAIELYKSACSKGYEISCVHLYDIFDERQEKEKFFEFVDNSMGKLAMLKLLTIPFVKKCIAKLFKK